MKKALGAHPVAGAMLGLLAGGIFEALLMSFAYVPDMMLTGLIVTPMIAGALLGVWAGPSSLALMTGSCLFSAYTWGGSAALLAVTEGIFLPAWGVLMILHNRPRFYQGVAQSACLHFGALVVLVFGGWMMTRQELISVLLKYLRHMVDLRPETPMMLSTMGQMGLFGTSGGINFAQGLSQAQQGALLDELFALYERSLQTSLAEILLHAGLLGGSASYWLCARVLARRGEEPIISYAHPREWFLPTHLVVGPPLCMLACFIADRAGMRGADAAYYAMEGLCLLVLAAQGLGAMDRMLFSRGVQPGPRAGALALLMLLAQRALSIIGCISALFGRKGLITTWQNKWSENHRGGDGA